MREFHVSMAFLGQGDRYYFQKRVGPFISGAIGKIGCFGGQIEEGESFEEAASREVQEETGLHFLPQKFHYRGQVRVLSDRDGIEIRTKAEIFDVSMPQEIQISAVHGELVTILAGDLKGAKYMRKYTPATRAAVEKFF